MKTKLVLILALWLYSNISTAQLLVLQSDFGVEDGAVAAMKGVACGVSPRLGVYDLTHAIPPFNIWEAAYRLQQAAPYWPAGTVFVSIVDPGVGSQRKSVVLKTRTGHYFVSPDNGTLTLIAESLGIEAVREIDEARNRLKNSQQSYTFHGRDVYAYTGARLASGTITFNEVGPELPRDVVRLPYQKPVFDQGVVKGNIPVLDVNYGNVWTNIDQATFNKLGLGPKDNVRVTITHDNTVVYEGEVPFVRTFSDVAVGQPLGYANSLLNFSLGINQGNFAAQHRVAAGPAWTITLRKAPRN